MKARYLAFSLSFLAPCCALAQIPWPVPFETSCGHRIYGTLGEARGVVGQLGAHLHDGVDIGNPENDPVYAVSAGQVSTGFAKETFADKWVRVGNYAYVHLKSFSSAVLKARNTHQPIAVGTLLGYTNWRGHVHFKSGPAGGATNPLSQLVGYADTISPMVSAAHLQDHASRQPLPQESDDTFIFDTDSVDLVVDAFDEQSCGSLHTGLYSAGYSVKQNSTGQTLVSHVGFVFRFLPTTDPNNVYLEGSQAGEGGGIPRFLYITNDTIEAQRPIDISSYPAGSYTFAFTGCDIKDNCANASVIAVKKAQVDSIERIQYGSPLIDSLPGNEFPRGGTYTAVIRGVGLLGVNAFAASSSAITGSIISATDTEVTVQVSSTPVPENDTVDAPILGVSFTLSSAAGSTSSGSVTFDVVAGPPPEVINFTITNGVTELQAGTTTVIQYSAEILSSGNVQFLYVGCGLCQLNFGESFGDQFDSHLIWSDTATIPSDLPSGSYGMEAGAVDGAGQGGVTGSDASSPRTISIPVINLSGPASQLRPSIISQVPTGAPKKLFVLPAPATIAPKKAKPTSRKALRPVQKRLEIPNQ